MNKITKYSNDDMLLWLEEHFKNKGYDVTHYSEEFLPVRVPLHCIKENHLFTWDKVPGIHSERLRKFLNQDLDINLAKNTVIRKVSNNKTISIKTINDLVKVTLDNKKGKVTLLLNGEKVNSFEARKSDSDLKIYGRPEELVIDITIEQSISKKLLLPPLFIDSKIEIAEASPLSFYQYYFPYAKILLAYPDYVDDNYELKKFKNRCALRGFGMLETSEKGVTLVKRPKTLMDIMRKGLHTNYSNILSTYLENISHYLVYYPDPVYRRRSIIGELKGQISYVLIDKLKDIKHLDPIYRNKFVELFDNYRQLSKYDYQIAHDYIKYFWKERLGLKYPAIQVQMEELLQRKERYRDHFVHQFQVFLMGAYILDKLWENKSFKKIREDFKKDYYINIEDVWLAASTYHDFNYGLQEFDFWLMQFFSDTLYIKNDEAKERLNILNLDAAMVREYLSVFIERMVKLIKKDENTNRKVRQYFYEKVVKDRNHGVLSALSFMKLCEHKNNVLGVGKIQNGAILQAAFAMACHDEDIWEALSGCKGYLMNNNECEPKKCHRILRDKKKIEVQRHKMRLENEDIKCEHIKCEKWEGDLMAKNVMGKIDFNKWPILFLLIYCDSVQEEGRVTSKQISKTDNEEYNKNGNYIKITSKILNEWADQGKKALKEYQKIDEVKDSFNKVKYCLSDNARAFKYETSYETSEDTWKIVDENKVYIIENIKGTGYRIKRYPKESTLNDIKIDKKIVIKLNMDNTYEKIEELKRIAWVLKGDQFEIHLEEKNTLLGEEIKINGSGG